MTIRALLGRRELPMLLLAGLAVLLLFGRLGAYGFWEPHEIKAADRARAATRLLEDVAAMARPLPATQPAEPAERDDGEEELPSPLRSPVSDPGAAGEPGMGEGPAPVRRPQRTRPAGATAGKRATVEGPRLTEELVEAGIVRIGQTELGARFFLALAGLVAVLAVAALAARLAGRSRAGLFAGLVMLSFPLVILESRHLTSEIGTLAGAALFALGLTGLVQRSPFGPLSPPYSLAVDALLAAAGALLVERGAALWNGVLPPLAGIAIGALVAGLAERGGERPDVRRWLLVAGGLGAAAALTIAGVVFAAVFDVAPVGEGARGLFGYTLEPVELLLSRYFGQARLAPDQIPSGLVASLGGVWRADGDLNATTTALFEQVAFGAFPWSAVAPLAFGALALGGRTAERRFAGAALAGWAAVAWVTATVFEHKVGATTYPAFAALAVAIGVWLDDLWDGEVAALPVAAAFVLFAALILGRDLSAFSDRLTSLNLEGAVLKWPTGTNLHRALPAIGAGFGLAFAAALLLGGRRARERAAALGVALAIAVGGAAFFSQVFSPRLADRFSTKGVFATYQALRAPGDVLGVVGDPGPGPRFYAGEEYVKLNGRGDLLGFLKRPERVFALTRASELCALHKSTAQSGATFVLVDDSNEQFLLLSNRLGSGEVDHNPLAEAVVRQRPTDLGRPLDFVFEDSIRLVGVRLPARIGRGDDFAIELIFEILKPVGRNWKVFLHFDSGTSRFQGDHDPLRGRCGTTFFQPGDFVIDRHEMTAGSLRDGTPKGRYAVYAGFFFGSNPNYTNAKVTRGEADGNNRVKIATIDVE